MLYYKKSRVNRYSLVYNLTIFFSKLNITFFEEGEISMLMENFLKWEDGDVKKAYDFIPTPDRHLETLAEDISQLREVHTSLEDQLALHLLLRYLTSSIEAQADHEALAITQSNVDFYSRQCSYVMDDYIAMQNRIGLTGVDDRYADITKANAEFMRYNELLRASKYSAKEFMVYGSYMREVFLEMYQIKKSISDEIRLLEEAEEQPLDAPQPAPPAPAPAPAPARTPTIDTIPVYEPAPAIPAKSRIEAKAETALERAERKARLKAEKRARKAAMRTTTTTTTTTQPPTTTPPTESAPRLSHAGTVTPAASPPPASSAAPRGPTTCTPTPG